MRQECGFEFPENDRMTLVLPTPGPILEQQAGMALRGILSRTLRAKEVRVPTSVWNNQLAGQGQRDDGVLVNQGREGACREKRAGQAGAHRKSSQPNHNLRDHRDPQSLTFPSSHQP